MANPFAANRGPRLHVTIGGRDWTDQAKDWSLSDDITQIGDQFAFTIPNPDGEHSGEIAIGSMVEASEASPDVNSGQPAAAFRGRVTDVETGSDISGGSVILVTCADLGWHLAHTAGKPWTLLEGLTLERLLKAVVDPTWGITGVVAGNELTRHLKQGRRLAQREANPQLGAVYERIMIDPGEMVAQVVTLYAAREHKFLNVSPRGELVFFTPRYDTDPAYFVRYHGDSRRTQNNIIGRPKLKESIEGRYTSVELIYQDVIKSQLPNTENPLDAYHKRILEKPGTLPFKRRMVVVDSEVPLTVSPERRAQWYWGREMFGTFTYEVQLPAHSQGGLFFASDSMVAVEDTVNKVTENLYVSSVRRSQTESGGTTATLLCHKPGLLTA